MSSCIHTGEAGAIGAALVALDWWDAGGQSKFRGFEPSSA